MTGNQIKRARKARGLSVVALAREADVPYFTLYGWERGRTSPAKREHRQRILEALSRIPILSLDK